MPVMNMRLLAHGPELRHRLAPVCLRTAGKKTRRFRCEI